MSNMLNPTKIQRNMHNFLLLCLLSFSLVTCKKATQSAVVKQETPLKSAAFTSPDGYGSDRLHNLNVIYFVPKDLDTIAGYKKRVSEILLMGQKFYREEMTRNGYPDKTFGLWVNSNRVKIITIFGTKNKSEYPREGGAPAIEREINAYFAANPKDQTSMHTLILLPPYAYNADGSPIDGPFYGSGKWCYALDYEGLELKYMGTNKFTKWYGGMMHELGHGLNLPHNCLKLSERSNLGTALMGAGNYTLSVSKTSLTATDAAILNANQIFNTDDLPYYGNVKASISNITAGYDAAKAAIVISGKYVSDTKVNSVLFYNDPNVNNEGSGVSHDYNSVTWETKPTANNEFNITFPLSDFEFKDNTEYELRLNLVHENGTVSRFSYVYSFVNGIPVLDFNTRPELNKQGWSIYALSSEETTGEGAINGKAANLIDSDLATYWHSKWSGTKAIYPHQVTVALGASKLVEGFSIVQRNSLSRSVKDIEILYSNDGKNFTSLGNFVLANTAAIQYFKMPSKQNIGYFKLVSKSAHDGSDFAALAELGAF